MLILGRPENLKAEQRLHDQYAKVFGAKKIPWPAVQAIIRARPDLPIELHHFITALAKMKANGIGRSFPYLRRTVIGLAGTTREEKMERVSRSEKNADIGKSSLLSKVIPAVLKSQTPEETISAVVATLEQDFGTSAVVTSLQKHFAHLSPAARRQA